MKSVLFTPPHVFYWCHIPNLLVFDEATNNLDVQIVEVMGNAFAKFNTLPFHVLPTTL